MRELKFRAWWKDTKRFLDGDEWYMTCSGAKHLHYSIYPYSDDDFIIEQHTGLKDKNGKDIYEGDIVRWTDDYDENGYIDFGDGCFRVNWSINSERINCDMVDDLEVIGNVHEDDDLLGDKE